MPGQIQYKWTIITILVLHCTVYMHGKYFPILANTFQSCIFMHTIMCDTTCILCRIVSLNAKPAMRASELMETSSTLWSKRTLDTSWSATGIYIVYFLGGGGWCGYQLTAPGLPEQTMNWLPLRFEIGIGTEFSCMLAIVVWWCLYSTITVYFGYNYMYIPSSVV